jgi:hypothetical protein
MSQPITRTIYGSLLQTTSLLGLPFTIKTNTTLNEKFGVQAGILPDVSAISRMVYMAVGNGGHKFSVGGNGIPRPDPLQHKSTDAALFQHLPFVMREPNNDLQPAERAKYAMRREEVHNGVRYFAYYLKRISLVGVTAAMEYKNAANGEVTTTPFTPNSSNLNPTPQTLNSNGVAVTTGDYVTATAKITISLTKAEVEELLEVARILYADPGYAIISEIALVSGVDKDVQSPGVGSTTIAFKEVIGAQVCSHVSAFYALSFANNGIEMVLDVGSSEPLFNIA